MVQFVKKLDQFSSSQTNDVNIMNDNKATLLNVKDKQLNQHTLTKIQEKMPDIKIERIYPLAPSRKLFMSMLRMNLIQMHILNKQFGHLRGAGY